MRALKDIYADNSRIRLRTSIVPLLAKDGKWTILRPANPLRVQSSPLINSIFQNISRELPIKQLIEIVSEDTNRTYDSVLRALELIAAKGLIFEERDAPSFEDENGRYARQIDQFAQYESSSMSRFDYQSRIRHASLTQIGVGGLGTWITMNLAMAGIGELNLVDGDTVEKSNLNRQILYDQSEIGALKASVAARKLHTLNPDVKTRFDPIFIHSQKDAEAAIPNHTNLVILSADEPLMKLRVWVSEACYKKQIPLLMVASGGVGPLIEPNSITSCWHCQELYLEEVHPEIRDWLAEIDSASRGGLPQGIYPGYHSLMAGLVMIETIKFITGMQVPQSKGAILVWNQGSSTITREVLPVHPKCERHEHA